MIAISAPRPIIWAQPPRDKSGAHYLNGAAQQKAAAGLRSATAFQKGGRDTQPLRQMSPHHVKKKLARAQPMVLSVADRGVDPLFNLNG
jgi:hypothetical protein